MDLEKAEALWKHNRAEELSKALLIGKKQAVALCERVDWDTSKAHAIYHAENSSDVDNSMASGDNAEAILANFESFIRYKYNILGECLPPKDLEQLPLQIKHIMILIDWYGFYEWEHISVEQTSTMPFIEIIEHQLGMKQFAESLRELSQLVAEFNRKYARETLGFKTWLHRHNELKSSENFKRLKREIDNNRLTVMQKTLAYLREYGEIDASFSR